MTAINRNPANKDLLQSTKFQVNFGMLPGVTYFCNSVNLPGISLTEIPFPTPFVDLYIPGEKAIYDTLNITFLVDEDLRAWTEMHDWIRGATFPTNFSEYLNLARVNRNASLRSLRTTVDDKPPVYSDATMTIYTNKNNPNFRVKFVDVFPTTVGSLSFSVGDSAENIITADATFRFSFYEYERIKS
jgi:hypothetical protein